MESILVTGGTGYIGSHICVELIKQGYNVIIVDNLSNSNQRVLGRIEKITGTMPKFYYADLSCEQSLSHIFEYDNISAVIHLAGYKAVGESVTNPIKYYDNNLIGTIKLIETMKRYACKNLIFSSSATVYGNTCENPVSEYKGRGIACANPYGWTKWMIEQILMDLYQSNNAWNITLLRYFNPIGAHESGLIGEDPTGIPNNLLPYISRVAIGQLDHLNVFGDDYNTPDGTCIRDYIHVVDLALGHISALNKLNGLNIYNLGTGRGYSVFEVLTEFEKACGHKIKYEIKPRRAGDIPVLYCNPEIAHRKLGWKAKYDLADMCYDTWRWQKQNPNGYRQ